MQSVIPVSLPQNAYAIAITPGNLDHIGAWITGETLTLKPHSKFLVVSNPLIFRAYGQRVTDSLIQAGFEVTFCILPAGERYKKTPATVQKIYDAALRKSLRAIVHPSSLGRWRNWRHDRVCRRHLAKRN